MKNHSKLSTNHELKNILFSIVTCTKNSREFIEDNLKSVSSQTFKNYEHIIIDGHSSDGTVEIVKNYAYKDPRIKIFIKDPKGISNALNQGIIHSKGDYIIHLNSDDFFHNSEVLHAVHSFLKKTNFPDVVYGKIQTIESDKSVIGKFPNHRIFHIPNYSLLNLFNFIPHQSVFVRKNVFTQHGMFDEHLNSSMDYDLWLRIMNKTHWLFFNRIISDYRIRIGSQSSDKKNHDQNEKDLFKIRRQHMNSIQCFIAYILNKIIQKFYKLYR